MTRADDPGRTGDPGTTDDPGTTGDPGRTGHPGTTGDPGRTGDPNGNARPMIGACPSEPAGSIGDSPARSLRQRAELARALAVCAEEPPAEEEGRRSLARIAGALGLPSLPDRAEHTEVFVLELPPYASVYLGEDGMIGGEAAARVAGFFRTLGTGEPAEPDNLVSLLALYAALLEAEADALGADSATDPPAVRELLGRAATTLLMEHLASWLLPYLTALARQPSAFYRALANTLSQFIEAEVRSRQPSDLHPDAWCGAYVPPGLSKPADPPSTAGGGREFVAALLVPARSGMVLTRSRLASCASTTGAATRVGERRFVLELMLGERPREVLEWLRHEAADWTHTHRSAEPLLGEIARAWAIRAETTARVVEAELQHLAA